MGEKGLKWCDIFLALFGTILSFGDPITWYSYTGEILPRRSQEMVPCGACIYYFAMFHLFPSSLHTQFIQRLVPQYQTNSHTNVPFWCSSRFCPALVKLKMLLYDLKKLCGAIYNKTSDGEEHDGHLRRDDSRYFPLFEAVFESAPQFIMHIHVMAVQKASVTSV